MASYTLKHDLSAIPLNCNFGYNNSWINVENNADRHLFAQASYITNFSDVNISLSASNLQIGNVRIQDSDTGLLVDVVPVGAGMGALRVLSQDLESYQDDITIGDKNGNFASVCASVSALQVLDKSREVTSWDVLSANLVASGFSTNTFTALPSNPANIISISNVSNDILWVKNVTKTLPYPLPINATLQLELVGNTNEVSLATSKNQDVMFFAIFTKYN